MYCLTKVDVDEIYSTAIKMIGQNEA